MPRATTATRPRHALGDVDSRFTEFSGVEIHHKIVGDGTPEVVLFHHTFGSVFTWRHVLDGLSAGARVAAFDRPGFGLSDRPKRRRRDGTNPYTRSASVDITLALMDSLGMDRAVLVGSSAGGTIALETYRRAPDRVAGLVLLSPAITGDVGPPASWRPILRWPPLRRIGLPFVRRLAEGLTVERVSRSWYDTSAADADDLDAYLRPLEVEGWDRGFYEVVTAEPPPNLIPVLRTIEVPTLVVTGDHDRVIRPGDSRRTAAAIPDARFELIPGCGHTPHEECPDRLLPLLKDFLGSVG